MFDNLLTMISGQQQVQDLGSTEPCTVFKNHADYIINGSGVAVTCSSVPSMEEIKLFFSSLATPLDIEDLSLLFKPSDFFIPVDFLGESNVTSLSIVGSGNVGSLTSLIVDPNAFRSSKNTLQYFSLMYCNTDKLDLQFLKGFQSLHHMLFWQLSNLHRSLPTLPTLPSLNGLAIWFSTGLNETWQSTDNIVLQSGVGLKDLLIFDCELNGDSLAQILDWIMPSSVKTLSSLHITFNKIDFTPWQLSSFRGLKKTQLTHNKVDLVLPKNSFYLQDKDMGFLVTDKPHIDLSNSRIVEIEPGAFQGNIHV